jgi:hypothetical protein
VGGLWSELGKKLADRWLSLLVLPGVLYLATATAAALLGQSHALSAAQLARQVHAYAKATTVTNVYGQIVVLVAILAAAAAIGLLAQAIGTLVEHLALSAGWRSWPSLLRRAAEWQVRDKQRRWDAEDRAYWDEYQKALAPDPSQRPDPAPRHRAARRRAHIAIERPERPTWSGDRVHAAVIRLDRDLNIDLATVWPCLWLTYPDTVRAEITEARTILSRATMLAAWAILYAPLTWWWWPAAPISIVLAATARYRIRAATENYARLLEASTRLYVTDLATQLGFDHSGAFTSNLGANLTRYLRTQAPSQSQRDTE